MSPVQAWARGFESGQSIAGAGGATMVLTLTNPGAQTSPHGSAISTLTVSAGGHGPSLTYAAAGLPTGLSINSGNGQVTGTPTVVGLFSPIVTVTDASTGDSAGVQFDWSIT